MVNYGFGIDVHGNAIKTMSEIGRGAQKMEHEATEAAHKIHEGFKDTFSELKSMALGFLGVMAAGDFIKSSVESFNKLDEAEVKLNAQLAATGIQAGLNEERLKDMADALSGKVIFPKADILEAEGMLSMFKSINAEMYEKTIPLSADLASKMGIGLPEAARMLGKSLDNLDLGRLQAKLGKLGETQKAQIKYFKETGQTAKAQGVIYDFVKDKVGGLSEQLAKTPEGKLKMAGKSLTDLKIAAGGAFMTLAVNVIPIFLKLVEGIKDFSKWVSGASTSATIFKEILILAGSILIGYYTYLGAVALGTAVWTAAQWLLNVAMDANPISLIVIGIAALITAIMILWDKCEGFREAVGGIFEIVSKYVMGMVHYFMDLGKIIGDVFTGKWGELRKDAKQFTTDFKNDFISGWADAWKKGAEKGKNSTFRFADLLSFGKKEGEKGHAGLGDELGGEGGEGSKSALAENAYNTSDLAGAKGGLGEAKIINIRMDDALKIVMNGGDSKDILANADRTMDVVLRAINNVTHSQSGIM